MSSAEKIEEWIHEVEERPSSAPVILQYISNRLFSLISRNEELLAENIELRAGRKVEEYEQRIANLEYQLEMLKRQMGGENFLQAIQPRGERISLILYNHKGKIIRCQLDVEAVKSAALHLAFKQACAPSDLAPRMLVTTSTEELLFVFDSGRTEAYPAETIPAQEADTLRWEDAWLVEPRGGEELSTVLPLARMSLYDFTGQVSRRGCARKMMMTSFEAHMAKKFIGTGIKQRPDRTCTLVLANKTDRLVLASQEGFLISLAFDQLGYTAEEVIRLATSDHILTAFVLGEKESIAVVTNTGKVIQRETGWLEPVESFRSKG
ncbi:MAG: hypothetical protein IH586_13515, partial [Anaerolineaceae bacterium]|nr:hypothetical protein [Anaerolineaceae bacterium]